MCEVAVGISEGSRLGVGVQNGQETIQNNSTAGRVVSLYTRQKAFMAINDTMICIYHKFSKLKELQIV